MAKGCIGQQRVKSLYPFVATIPPLRVAVRHISPAADSGGKLESDSVKFSTVGAPSHRETDQTTSTWEYATALLYRKSASLFFQTSRQADPFFQCLDH